ncbi:MAG: type II toxin-antitoxin system HicA family toxin [Candidatus Poribacteria bacterium]
MPKQPRITGRQVIAALKRLGFEEIRQHGSHVTLYHHVKNSTCTVPTHAGKIIAPKTLRSIVKQAGISVNDLLR